MNKNASETNRSYTKLEPVQIPPFSGSYIEWHPFKDLFVSMVDKNSRLTKTQKFHHLKSKLTGQAKGVIDHLPTSEDSKDLAWEAIQERYDSKKNVVKSHLERFKSLAAVKTPKVEDLRKIYDISTTTISAHIPFSATRGRSLLDLALLPDDCHQLLRSYGQQALPGVSDHDLIQFSFSMPKVDKSNRYRFMRDLKRVDTDSLLRAAADIDWQSVNLLPSVNYRAELLSGLLGSLFESHVPFRRVLLRNPRTPWMRPYILRAIQDRDRAYREWRSSGQSSHWSAFKVLRNKVKTLIRDAKSNYYHGQLNPSQDPAVLWRNLGRLGLKRTSHSAEADPNALNLFFCSVTPRQDCPCPPHIFTDTPVPEFNFQCVPSHVVLSAIQRVNSSAVGVDEISLDLIRLILPVILPCLTDLVNFAITSSSFPLSWKSAVVVPIPKVSAPSAVSDFRLISILPALSKPLEIILLDQMTAHLERNNLLCEFQSGFRKNHSTVSALLRINHDIAWALDRAMFSVLVLLDFSKAFDSISHSLLCNKLQGLFGFSTVSVRLIQSYLASRSQIVRSGHSTSSALDLTRGVPQGTILGPIIFSLFINDLPQVLRYCGYHLYAHDLQIYCSGDPLNSSHAFDAVNDDLERISHWADNNGPVLNARKSQALLVHSRGRNPISFPLFLSDEEIPLSSKVKNLGVIFNDTLIWSDHVAEICRKVFLTLRTLRRYQTFTPRETRLLLVRTLIVPFFTYGCELFFRAHAEDHSRLRLAFNSCLRYVFGLRKYDHVSAYGDSILGLPLPGYLDTRVVDFISRILSTGRPRYLTELVVAGSSSRSSCLRVPGSGSRNFRNSIFVEGVILWNALPRERKRGLILSHVASIHNLS
ncbi:uncharacterized protein LOC129809180 [Phlebotomus papatasi]|uniref:uncharacterized protein LOC129809180 n=1 Tax=Phlebotomus papatasi TaxID=29031 RepID=UPI002483313F|nr:uncharacterized protein LOC129809180 [Phlebotomus papatasi]